MARTKRERKERKMADEKDLKDGQKIDSVENGEKLEQDTEKDFGEPVKE